MKLIDILIAADFEWDERYGFAAQDSDGGVWLFLDKPRLMGSFASAWIASSGESIALADDLASDYRTAVITRDEYLSARDAAKPKGHPHATLMAEYAEVALTNPEPWLEFECKDEVTGLWHAFAGNPAWVTRIEHRRKSRTIRIGKYDVLEPVREPLEYRQEYFAVMGGIGYTPMYEWENDDIDNRLLKQGRIHLTREAAELHTKALLSFTQQ